jgi:hypothetical protein
MARRGGDDVDGEDPVAACLEWRVAGSQRQTT